ncbi:redox-sensitive transcriptional activator SoxR [Pacificibacter marinus]|uniref:Redox-sensitive transcriptional activator SoxR n=1 Tax=Pacificibacter marinus TaxID=658057 RepID=A0A1Y5TDC4_9RHOB|nr:redox-sensitive transcriptional activator SoxR [Pacificibacter marinus]SEL13748.1 transcriptional regulator, MerR family [Pacificibacter marinus]SLN61582.1 Redox-sensitive transcriptional activator SoxR [Pacificibacter marinus]
MALGTELSIGQVAQRTGVAVSALRYYETQGLLQANRNAGGQRRFARATLRRISFIIAAQKFGFSIARIRELFVNLPENRTPNETDWSKIALEFRAELDAKIASLEKLRDNLDGCIGCGCLSMKKCALYNADDKVAAHGAGAQLL